MQTRIHLLQKTSKEETDAIKKELQVHISAQKLDRNCILCCVWYFVSLMRSYLVVFSVVIQPYTMVRTSILSHVYYVSNEFSRLGKINVNVTSKPLKDKQGN